MNKYLYKKAITIPIYRGKLLIILTNSVKKLKKIDPEYEGKKVYAHAMIIPYKKNEAFTIVLNFNSKEWKIYHGAISHESFHIANFITDKRGIISSFENDEPIAYLTDWITDQVYKFIKEKKMFDLIK